MELWYYFLGKAVTSHPSCFNTKNLYDADGIADLDMLANSAALSDVQVLDFPE